MPAAAKNSGKPAKKTKPRGRAFEPGQSGPPHMHDTEIEIYIVLSGAGTITFNNDKSYPLTPDHMIYVPPKTLHETVNTGNAKLVFYGIFVPAIDLNGMSKCLRNVS